MRGHVDPRIKVLGRYQCVGTSPIIKANSNKHLNLKLPYLLGELLGFILK